MFIIKLGNYSIIFAQLWIKKHKVNIDIKNNFLALWTGYYTQIRTRFYTILSIFRLIIKIIVVRIKENITSHKIIKKAQEKISIIFYKHQI